MTPLRIKVAVDMVSRLEIILVMLVLAFWKWNLVMRLSLSLGSHASAPGESKVEVKTRSSETTSLWACWLLDIEKSPDMIIPMLEMIRVSLARDFMFAPPCCIADVALATARIASPTASVAFAIRKRSFRVLVSVLLDWVRISFVSRTTSSSHVTSACVGFKKG